jgi:hypothetical protein
MLFTDAEERCWGKVVGVTRQVHDALLCFSLDQGINMCLLRVGALSLAGH